MAHDIKKYKTDMCQYAKGVVTTYWFGFAEMQIAIGNSSIHHQRAMEIMTNSSFQKPIIHKK
jgi:hypothetical protein